MNGISAIPSSLAMYVNVLWAIYLSYLLLKSIFLIKSRFINIRVHFLKKFIFSNFKNEMMETESKIKEWCEYIWRMFFLFSAVICWSKCKTNKSSTKISVSLSRKRLFWNRYNYHYFFYYFYYRYYVTEKFTINDKNQQSSCWF